MASLSATEKRGRVRAYKSLHSRAHPVHFDLADHREQIAFAVDDRGAVTAFPQRAAALVRVVEYCT